MEDYNPCPLQYQGTAPTQLESCLEKVRGTGLFVSLLLDPSTCQWSDCQMQTSFISMQDTVQLQHLVSEGV